MIWMFFWFLINDAKWRMTDPISWARWHAGQTSKGLAYFWAVLMTTVLVVDLAHYTPGDFGGVVAILVMAVLAPTECLVAYFAHKADRENDDEDQDGNHFAWVH